MRRFAAVVAVAIVGGIFYLRAPGAPPRDDGARTAAESARAKTAIDAINERYARYLAGNQADSVASLFMERGVMMPPNSPALTGREAIRAYVASGPMPPGSTVKFVAVDVQANGPMVIERGTYQFAMPAVGKAPAMTITGKYLVHWHDVKGTWQQAATSWSDDSPSTPPPAVR